MANKKTVILGAGLAGLSAAWHLQKKARDCLVFEKEDAVGGLCRSKSVGRFTFDYCGHLLHFRNKYTFDLVRRLLSGELARHEKQAWIYLYGRYLRHPFQHNLYGLPHEIIKECITEFIGRPGSVSIKRHKVNFLDWINSAFGKGIARHFMIPYNHKFWTVHPRELNCDWLDGFIPVPSLRDILRGLSGEPAGALGYNAVFWYPKKGGISKLSSAFASDIRGLHTSCEITAIDIKNKRIVVNNGSSHKFDTLILTLPLPEILGLCKNIPQKVRTALKRLRYSSIINFNLGIRRKKVSDKHWVYYPEKKLIFYRCGFYSNFSADLSPERASSLYVETAYSGERPLNKGKLMSKIKEDLLAAGLLCNSDKILEEDLNDIKYGYIIYDKDRKLALSQIKDFLYANGIICCGRYGSWSYMSMEDVILDGKRAADSIRN